MAALSDKAREILDKKTFLHLATLMPDGAPQVTPVWVSTEGDDVLVNTARGRVKSANLERDPRVAMGAVNPDNPYENFVARGRVTEMTADGADEHINALAKKYLDEDEYPFRQPGEVRLKVRIEVETASAGMG